MACIGETTTETRMRQTDLKQAAERVLARISETSMRRPRAGGAVEHETDGPKKKHELSHLCLLAGAGWPEVCVDPGQLIAHHAEPEAAKAIRQGRVPEQYIATTVCRRCGQVPIFPGLPAKVGSCPWCFNRVAGLRVPVARPPKFDGKP